MIGGFQIWSFEMANVRLERHFESEGARGYHWILLSPDGTRAEDREALLLALGGPDPVYRRSRIGRIRADFYAILAPSVPS